MIYIYLKTHKITGLKYLGKTEQDPFIYSGSGLRWKRHLQKHGNEVLTEILFQSENKSEIKERGLYYSNLWNITENSEFANIIPESGDGGNTSNSENYRKGMKTRDVTGSKNPMYGRSAVVENKLRWYNNGVDNIYVPEGTHPPDYYPGRIIIYKKPHSEDTKRKLSNYGKKPCVSPKGEIFESRKAAAEAYGITSEAIGGLIKRQKSGWKWL